MSEEKPVSVMLIGFMPNPRIYKRIDLEKKLLDLHLVCWDKGSNMLLPPKEDGYSVHIIKINAGNDPLKRLKPYLKFFIKAKKILENIQPTLIHVQGLDMLKIAISYKKKSAMPVKVIYEVADLHRLIVGKQKKFTTKIAQKYLINEDKRCCRDIDLLIVTSQKHIDFYFKNFISPEKMLCIPNIPNLSAFYRYKKKERDKKLVVGYIGSVRYKQQMKNLIFAAAACDVDLMIAGFESEPVEIEPLCKDRSNIKWVGRFDFNSQVAALYGECDVMYSVYDADMENVRIAIPNKLYESIYCDMPIIVAKNTYLAEVVHEWKVGVAVDHRKPDELIEVLKKMRDDTDYYNAFVQACQKRKGEIDLAHYNDKLAFIVKKWL